MAEVIARNAKLLREKMNVEPFLEDLVEESVLTISEYTHLAEKVDVDGGQAEAAKGLVRLLLKKNSSELVEKFVRVLKEYQPELARNVEGRMSEQQQQETSTSGEFAGSYGESYVQYRDTDGSRKEKGGNSKS